MSTKYAQYFAIETELHKKGIEIERTAMVQEFTGGKKHGLTDLSAFELNLFNQWMKNKKKELEKRQYDPCNNMRRKIIAHFHKMDWKNPDGKADMDRIEAWCIQYGQFHKKLNDHNYKELVNLCSQVEKVYQTFIEAT